VLKHRASAWTGILAATLFAGSATGETYFRDATVEVSGSGMRSSADDAMARCRGMGYACKPPLGGLCRVTAMVRKPVFISCTALIVCCAVGARAQQPEFPDGAGKPTFLAYCGAC